MDIIPGLSQLKSAVQLLTGDTEGAARTQERFFHECPIVAQATSVGYLVSGNSKKFVETNERSVKTVGAIADGVPVVGHVKGAIHYAVGDKKGGNRAMKSASRSTVVMAAGAGGFVVGGPVGAVLAGASAGTATDLTYSVATGRGEGIVGAIERVIDDPNAGNILDAAFIPVADSLAGYGGGQIAKSVTTKIEVSNLSATRDGLLNQMESGIESGSVNSGQALSMAKDINVLTQKIDSLTGNVALTTKGGAGTAASSSGSGTTTAIALPRNEDPKSETKPQTKEKDTAQYRLKHEKLEIKVKTELEKEIIQYLLNFGSKCSTNYTIVFKLFRELVGTELYEKAIAEATRNKEKILRLIRQGKKTKAGVKVDVESSSSSSEDEEKVIYITVKLADNFSIRVVHWNMCGITAQLGRPALGFCLYIALLNPDVLLFNELKQEKIVAIETFAEALGYKAVIAPSTRDRGPSMRGSAVFYKKKYRCVNSNWKRDFNGDLELVYADLNINGTVRRFSSCYLRKLGGQFDGFIDHLEDISNSEWTVIGGDLNLRKEDWLSKLAREGYYDTMNPNWKTNRSRTTETAIDYVLCQDNEREDILCHRPTPLISRSVHYPVCFDVETEINEDRTWCKDPTCVLCVVGLLMDLFLAF